MNRISFIATGIPRPQPRPRFNSKTSRVYTPQTAHAWKTAVAWAALGIRNRARVGKIDEPCSVSIQLRLGNTRGGDADNFAKAILDAITDSGLWTDDRLVMDLLITMRKAPLAKDCGATITIEWPLNLEEP